MALPLRAAFRRPPNLARYGIFETKYNAQIEDLGYRAASDRMDEILRAVA